MGSFAQDFAAAFNIGSDASRIISSDVIILLQFRFSIGHLKQPGKKTRWTVQDCNLSAQWLTQVESLETQDLNKGQQQCK
jgi:hypothetical protein